MAIADKLTKLSTDISNAYNEIENKGGTIPANKNTDNLASAIGSISTGTTPTGTKQVSITQNGTTTEDVTDYASAEISVNVPQPSGTKQISITANGTTTEDVANYSDVEITTNVPMPSGDIWEKHEIDFTLASSTAYTTILGWYVKECANHIIYPTDSSNTALNTIVAGDCYNTSKYLGTTKTPTGVSVSPSTSQFYVNDQTYNVVRQRGNINNKPAGDYRLIFYGVAK